jgi:L,D-transpeptidase ErfK/SrfK
MRRLGFTSILILLATLPANAAYDEPTFFQKTIPAYEIATPVKGQPVDTVIGQVRTYRVRKGDTLLDLARYFDLGYNEILDANPAIDPWVPPVGATILVPTEWILPCCTYEGVIVNIPEMRLFYYQRSRETPGTTIVRTYPVGLGRDDWRTPSGRFRITGKTVNPQWNIPESIRKEHIAERGDHRTFIPGGAPDNPLGKYRFELSLPMYRIHGTDIPWGVGMQVSHGCVRLYPEDVERLFPLVPVGTPGEFAYQPVKVGRRGGAIYPETHRDIYGQEPAAFSAAMAEVKRVGLDGQVVEDLMIAALEDTTGMPLRVSRELDDVAQTAAVGPGAVGEPAKEGAGDGVPDPDDDEARDD